MAMIEITCPGCSTVLSVPEDAIGKKGRCRACGIKFPIAPPVGRGDKATAPDDTILGWLHDASDTVVGQPVVSSGLRGGKGEKSDKGEKGEKGGKGDKSGSGSIRPNFDVRLDHVNTMGAFFRFGSNLLYDKTFRSSIPQICLTCGSRRGLSVHLLVWSNKLDGRMRGRQGATVSPIVLELDDMPGLQGDELLDKLPMVEHTPEPYCLPFPYYVCKSCSTVGAMVTDVHLDQSGQGEECELGISSLPVAEVFSRTVCGPDCPAAREIRQVRKELKDSPWRTLPLAVRIRIERWYKPQDGENFKAYFPDADYSKAEAGLAGIVITDSRLIYHKSMALTEMSLDEPIVVTPTEQGSGLQLEISSAGKTVRLSSLPPYGEAIGRFLRKPKVARRT